MGRNGKKKRKRKKPDNKKSVNDSSEAPLVSLKSSLANRCQSTAPEFLRRVWLCSKTDARV